MHLITWNKSTIKISSHLSWNQTKMINTRYLEKVSTGRQVDIRYYTLKKGWQVDRFTSDTILWKRVDRSTGWHQILYFEKWSTGRQVDIRYYTLKKGRQVDRLTSDTILWREVDRSTGWHQILHFEKGSTGRQVDIRYYTLKKGRQVDTRYYILEGLWSLIKRKIKKMKFSQITPDPGWFHVEIQLWTFQWRCLLQFVERHIPISVKY
jgi:hypothetical protein